MKVILLAIVFALGGGTAMVEAQMRPGVRSDSARLQGKFVLVGGTTFGDPVAASDLASSYRTTVGNHLTVIFGGQLLLEATVTMDSASRPRHMDYRATNDGGAVTTFAGLYEILGDTVRLCFGRPNGPRPAAMVPGPDQTLYLWVRAPR